MKALVYHGPGNKAWEEVARPTLIADSDAIVRVDTTTICGTDLHILKGDVPAMVDGRIIGHEAVGTVAEVGAAVKNVKVGDRVLVSCVSACGACRFCRESRYGQCTGGGGWILGNEIDGTQAEYVRVPFADNSTYPVPAGVSDEALLMLADILPTAYEVGVLNGHVQPGDVVAVVGAGPIGLSAISGARLFSPSLVIAIDLAATRLVRPVGRIANIGVHGKPVTLHLERLWTRDVTITTGLVDTYSTPTLLRLLTSGQINAERFVTHRFGFDDFIQAYDVFARAGETGALKVVLSR
jgi:alcohol dehydrogenase